MERLVLRLAKVFFSIFPFDRGKQTAANALYLKVLRKARGQALLKVGMIRFNLDLHDRIQAIFYMTKLYESKTLRAAVRALSTGNAEPVVLDIGANVGLLALQVKNWFPKAKIHMFEADQDVYRQLMKNIALNNLNHMTAHNIAVAETAGETLTFTKSLVASESGWGRLQNQENKNKSGATFTIQATSIDTYLNQNNIREVDLLKIDVEGAEALVLKGAARTLKAQAIQTIICEINPEALLAFSSSPNEISQFLAAFGYKFVKQVDMNSIFEKSNAP